MSHLTYISALVVLDVVRLSAVALATICDRASELDLLLRAGSLILRRWAGAVVSHDRYPSRVPDCSCGTSQAQDDTHRAYVQRLPSRSYLWSIDLCLGELLLTLSRVRSSYFPCLVLHSSDTYIHCIIRLWDLTAERADGHCNLLAGHC